MFLYCAGMCGPGLLYCNKAEWAIRLLWNCNPSCSSPFPKSQASFVTSADLGCPHLVRHRNGRTADQIAKLYIYLYTKLLSKNSAFTVYSCLFTVTCNTVTVFFNNSQHYHQLEQDEAWVSELKCHVLVANPEFEVIGYNCMVHIIKAHTKMWKD